LVDIILFTGEKWQLYYFFLSRFLVDIILFTGQKWQLYYFFLSRDGE